MNWIWVFIGGGLGSLVRFFLGQVLVSSNFPWATLTANLLSCVVVGGIIFITQGNYSELIKFLLLIGFCGGLSTFSTFSLENVELLRQGRWIQMLLYVGFSLIPCFLIIWGLSKKVS